MAKYRANGQLILRLKEVIGSHEHGFSGFKFYSYINVYGSVSQNSVRSAERSENCYEKVFRGIAVGLSDKLKEVLMNNPDSESFNPLKMPELGWLLERLQRGDEFPLTSEDLIMDHEDRYFIERYAIRLAVSPSVGEAVTVERSGQSAERFIYDNLASVTYQVKFATENRRQEKGFRLAYGTHNGRVKVLEPDEIHLTDEKGYRLHKRSAAFEPNPQVDELQKLRLLVFGGYGPGDEAAHFSMAQAALYQNVTFTLDLGAYAEEALAKEPELIIVPVLKDRKFDCCDIARKGQGLPVDHDTRRGMIWEWKFQGLTSVMICIRWDIDHSKISEDQKNSLDNLIRLSL